MIEVEIKVAADIDEVESRLGELGAERKGEKTQEDVYFTAPHRDFAETDEALRVRVEDGEAFVTYKGPKFDDGTKSREEFEVGVDDAETMADILESLGFDEFETVVKRRTVYGLDGYEVLLDDVRDVGEFVEVETEAEEDGFDEAREGAVEILGRLGLDASDSVRTSYLGLLLESRGRR